MGKEKKEFDSNELPELQAQQFYDNYDSAEFTVSTGTTNYNVSTQEADAFASVKKAHSCLIRTDRTITIRFNSTDNKVITLADVEGQLQIPRDMGLEITNIFITNNSGDTANIKILAVQ